MRSEKIFIAIYLIDVILWNTDTVAYIGVVCKLEDWIAVRNNLTNLKFGLKSFNQSWSEVIWGPMINPWKAAESMLSHTDVLNTLFSFSNYLYYTYFVGFV